MCRIQRRRLRAAAMLVAMCAAGIGCARGGQEQHPQAGMAATQAVPKTISASLRRERGGKFPFGKSVAAAFTLTNHSDRAVVVVSIRPVTNQVAEFIPLSGRAYGSLDRDDRADTYRFNPMNQRETQLPFYVGFLLPGQQLEMYCRYRPLYSAERFAVQYVPAGAKYDGKAASLTPFKVYVRKVQASLADPRASFVPFTPEAWKEVCKLPHAFSPGPDVGARGVLIPAFSGRTVAQEVELAIEYSGKVFPAEKALAAAARIAKVQPSQVKLAYSEALGGYVVMQGDSWWLLTGPDQAARGKDLPVVPPEMLRDVDARTEVRVRVGDKQEGLGPEKRPAGRQLWDKYPVEYGDGMYTRGEFIRINKGSFAAFLDEVGSRKLHLKTYTYYFRSRYFVLGE